MEISWKTINSIYSDVQTIESLESPELIDGSSVASRIPAPTNVICGARGSQAYDDFVGVDTAPAQLLRTGADVVVALAHTSNELR